MSHWRKPPPETKRTHRLGNLTIGGPGAADGGNPLGPGEVDAFYWLLSLPFRMLLFIARLLFKGRLKLQTVLKKE